MRLVFWPFLFPLSFCWGLAATLRRRLPRNPMRTGAYVISVGNLHSGGSGKTPTVRALVQGLGEANCAVVSRGYGATDPSWKRGHPQRVDPHQAKAARRFGDEPTLLAHWLRCAVWICKRRRNALSLVGSTPVVVLDDAFQHLDVHRDMDLVLINTRRNPGELLCLPLGDLREPVGALRHASAVLLLRPWSESGDYFEAWKDVLLRAAAEKPVFAMERVARGLFALGQKKETPTLPQGRFGLYCAVADPLGVEAELQAWGKRRGKSLSFVSQFHAKDHQALDASHLQKIRDWVVAQGLDAVLITEKDEIRFLSEGVQLPVPFYTFKIEHQLPDDFWAFLRSARELPK